jgi:Holin of 3TMs, for gene-transfer release
MNPLLIPVIGTLIDKIGDFFSTPEKKAEAQLKLYELERSGQLKELELQMSAILAEAGSTDPWTSRARPSFMYVIYIMLLMGIPMGFLSAYDPQMAKNVAEGFKAWLDAIPKELYGLFGVGYVGYAASRTYEKSKGLVK